MDLTYRTNYWDSPDLKNEFIRFLVQMFNLDLSAWDKLGYWDDRYRPFSFFDGDSLVANVCVYSMNMTVQGKERPVAQISAVATLPEYRRRGLGRQLLQTAIDWARDNHDFFYLFADEDAFRLYESCGFRPVAEHNPRIAASGTPARPGAEWMTLANDDHLKLVERLARRREPASGLLGVNNPELLMYWCLYHFRLHTMYIANLDTLVMFKRENGLVTIFDIVAETMPAFDEIYPYICNESDRVVEFRFMVDKLNLNPETIEHIPVAGNGTHVLGNFPLESTPFTFPLTCQA